MFIGGFQHPPNTDAVLWYAQEILPHVRAAAARRARRTSSAARCRRRSARSRPTTSSSPATCPTSTPYFTRLPRVDRAAALRRRRQGQDQPRDELRAARGRDDAVGRGHAPRARARTCWSPTTPKAFADAIVARLPTTRRCGSSSPPAAARTSARHFSRDVARSADPRSIALRRQHRARATRSCAARAGDRLRRAVTPARNTTSHTPWPSLRPRVSNLVSGRYAGRGAKPSAGVREQRLGGEASRGFPARTPPSRSRRAGSRRARAAARARARTPAAAAAACGGASSATDRERRRGCRRATPAESSRRRPRPRRAGSRARWRGRAASTALQQRAHARRVHLDAEEVVAPDAPAAIAAVVSPMPKPISSTTRRARGRTPRVEVERRRRERQRRSAAAARRARAAAPATSGPGAARSCGSGGGAGPPRASRRAVTAASVRRAASSGR